MILSRFRLFSIFVALFALMALAACGGGGGSSSSSPLPSISGVVADGPLYNALVFLDVNGNKLLDNGELSTRTDADGKYTLTGVNVRNYPIVAIVEAGVTVDQDNPAVPVSKNYVLTTPAGKPEFISPLTTAIQNVIENNPQESPESAELIVRGQLNLNPETSLFDNYLAQEGTSQEHQKLHTAARILAESLGTVQQKTEPVLNGSGYSEADITRLFDALVKYVFDKVMAQLGTIGSEVAANYNSPTFDPAAFDPADSTVVGTVKNDPAPTIADVEINVDTDSDGLTNDVDLDDDNDTWSDIDEIACGTSALDNTSIPADFDGDLICDAVDEDADNDGHTKAQGDSADLDPTIYPGAPEVCGDGIDQDLVGGDLSCDNDVDGDGFSPSQGDIFDNDPTIYPGAPEVCGDGIDQNLNGADLSCSDVDNDGDGYTENQGDLVDTDATIYPGAPEVCGDGIDQNLNGSDLSCNDVDNDGDGYTENQGDTVDIDATIYPGAPETCGDGIDQDLNGTDLSCSDVDNDGDGYTENQGDLVDTDATIYPGASEVCGDGIDQDLNGSDLACPPNNTTPVANAGLDKTVSAGNNVVVDGSGSTDAETATANLSFIWNFISVPATSSVTVASLTSATAQMPSFTPDVAGAYTLRLTVSDGELVSSDSVTVTATVVNLAPVANAGPDLQVTVGSPVNLSASASSDPNSDPLTYQWTLTVPPGSGASLSSLTAENVSFTPDIAGTYDAELVVNDGLLSSTGDVVQIVASASSVIPTDFTMEWLNGKTLYIVWFGSGEDALGNPLDNVAVVAKGEFLNGTVTVTGIMNSTDAVGTYGVTPAGGLYFDGETRELNTITCSDSNHLVTAYTSTIDPTTNNVDLFFFDQTAALQYAGTLTDTASSVCGQSFGPDFTSTMVLDQMFRVITTAGDYEMAFLSNDGAGATSGFMDQNFYPIPVDPANFTWSGFSWMINADGTLSIIPDSNPTVEVRFTLVSDDGPVLQIIREKFINSVLTEGPDARVWYKMSAGGGTSSWDGYLPSTTITLDGQTGDWAGITAAATDAIGDSTGASTDLSAVYIAQDADNLFLRMDLAGNYTFPHTGSAAWSHYDFYVFAQDTLTGTALGSIGVGRYADSGGTTYTDLRVYDPNWNVLGTYALNDSMAGNVWEIAIPRNLFPAGTTGLSLYPHIQIDPLTTQVILDRLDGDDPQFPLIDPPPTIPFAAADVAGKVFVSANEADVVKFGAGTTGGTMTFTGADNTVDPADVWDDTGSWTLNGDGTLTIVNTWYDEFNVLQTETETAELVSDNGTSLTILLYLPSAGWVVDTLLKTEAAVAADLTGKRFLLDGGPDWIQFDTVATATLQEHNASAVAFDPYPVSWAVNSGVLNMSIGTSSVEFHKLTGGTATQFGLAGIERDGTDTAIDVFKTTLTEAAPIP